MSEEPAEIRRGRGQALIDLAREDLDLHAIEDLQERITLLEEEIARARAKIARKQAGRSAAEQLFSRKD
jgi:uncharacterized small protein (DUF1192 family)